MINNIDISNPVPLFDIPKISREKMGIVPEELQSISKTLINFSEAYKRNWSSYSVSKENGLENAMSEFNKTIGIYSPNEIDINDTNSSFLVVWNVDESITGKPMDIWFARSLGVSGPSNERGLKVNYLKIATMDHISGNLSPDTIAGRKSGDWTIAFNAKRIVPLSK